MLTPIRGSAGAPARPGPVVLRHFEISRTTRTPHLLRREIACNIVRCNKGFQSVVGGAHVPRIPSRTRESRFSIETANSYLPRCKYRNLRSLSSPPPSLSLALIRNKCSYANIGINFPGINVTPPPLPSSLLQPKLPYE